MKLRLKCLAISLTLALSFFLNGCFFELFGYELGFVCDEIYASVGETVDLTQYLADTADEKNEVAFSSADTEVGYVSGSKFIVLEKGIATVTAKYRKDTATVTVIAAYDGITSLSIFSYDERAIRLSEAHEMEFLAIVNEGAQPGADIVWSVNGAASLITGKNFYFTPLEAGIYTVEAEALSYGISAEYSFVVFEEVPSFTSGYSGELLQRDGFSTVSFWAEDISAPSYVEWLVNGEVAAEQTLSSGRSGFELCPDEPGIYEVLCRINGVQAEQSDAVVITACGQMPINNLELDFDSAYPEVLIRWDSPEGEGDFLVEIGGNEYSRASYPERFFKGAFDASGLIKITQSQQIRVSYGGDGVFDPSSAVYSHSAVKATALSYLENRYFNGNYYITDDEELFDLFAYAMTFRPNSYRTTVSGKPCTQINLRMYMAYTSGFTPASLADKAWQRASQTGSYYLEASGSTAKNGIYQIKISFLTQNVPDNFATEGKRAYESLQIPHLGGDYSDEYPIDSRPLSFDPISTTEELYYVVNAGYRPNITEGSRAEALYARAKAVLSSITDEEMNEVEIAHAIFDYIMWQVSYDYSVLNNAAVSQSVLQPAFYLDGVFDTGFAVCDGMAKAYSLMCNIMGIDCVRVVGTAKSGESVAEHAWNKVRIEGEWYVVDCTWSDFLTSLQGHESEAASHKYFLVSDSDVRFNHFENDPSLYPATAEVGYGFYDNGVGELARIKNNQRLTAQIEEIIAYAIDNMDLGYTVEGVEYVSTHYVLEIKLDYALYTRSKNSFYSLLNSKLQSAGFSPYEYVIIEFDEICMVLFN